jgi:hypothetical protein
MDEAAREDLVNDGKIPLVEQLVSYAVGTGIHLFH